MKTVFMFSGQGSQAFEMGKKLYDGFDSVRKLFDRANGALGYDLREICFTKNDLLNETAYSQPALLTCGYAAYSVLSGKKDADIMMGLSLGEYTALTCAGAFGFEQAVSLVKNRGELMNGVKGGMTAVMNLDYDIVSAICEKIDGIYLANYNTFGQIVVAGDAEKLPECEALCKEAGAKCMRLKVSGPFHTPFLKEAADKFNELLDKTELKMPDKPIISNVTGDLLPEDTALIMENLKVHMISQVKWVNSVLKAMSLGADTFVELGHGKTLIKFVQSIHETLAKQGKLEDGAYPEQIKVFRAEELIWENQ